MGKKIKVGISSCLLGESVRYDGGHKLDCCLKDTLGKFVEWVGICPEVECGLGVPREAMYLADGPGSPRLLTKYSNIDCTDRMLKWAGKRLKELEKENLRGFVFKSNSPSCGLNSVFSEKKRGLFAKEFTNHFRHIPVEDNDRLQDTGTKEEFINKIREK